MLSTLAATAAGATPNSPRPSAATIMTRLDSLAGKAEVLAEKYNAARLGVAKLQHAAQLAQRDAQAAQRRYEAVRQPLMRIAVAQYEDASASSVAALMSSSDQQAYLDALATRDAVTHRFAGLAASLAGAKARADAAQRQAQAHLAAAQAAERSLDSQRNQVASQTTKYRTVLASLSAAQQDAYANRDAPTAAEIAKALQMQAPTAAAQRAVNFALAQLGKPYVFATAGPDTFDCSGLTMAAWARSGVVLPHLASAQALIGRRVSFADMQPGDLVFLYADIHHVELYIGNGLAVSAPQEGEPVKIVRVDQADFYGATRLA